MKTYEYAQHNLKPDLTETKVDCLNRLGKEGWMLVSALIQLPDFAPCYTGLFMREKTSRRKRP